MDRRLTELATGNRQSAILAIHPGALGDVILFGQLLDELRRRWGGRVRLAAVGSRGRLLAGLGVVDKAVDIESLPLAEVFAERPQGGSPVYERVPVRLGPCDVLVSCFATGNPAAERRLVELTGAKRAVFLPIRPPEDWPGHLVDHWAALVGIDSIAPPHWTIPGAWRDAARQELTRMSVSPDKRFTLICPGAGSRAKCWPLERFEQLAARLPAPPVFVVGPTELDWWGEAVVNGIQRAFPTVVAPPLEVLAGLAAEAAAVVGNDSGPSHLAAAVGAPTVAIFGATRPEHFAPRGRRVRVLSAGRLEEVDVAHVLAACKHLTDKGP